MSAAVSVVLVVVLAWAAVEYAHLWSITRRPLWLIACGLASAMVVMRLARTVGLIPCAWPALVELPWEIVSAALVARSARKELCASRQRWRELKAEVPDVA